MKSLAKYFYEIIKKEYQDWLFLNRGKGIPGRLILKEFDKDLVKDILTIIKTSKEFPIAPIGSEDGFILAVENHEQYKSIAADKYSFGELAHERNREGNYFCLMFIAEIKPTLEQVSGLDQSAVFEASELKRWIEIAKDQHDDGDAFLTQSVDALALFISELTNSRWNARPFIEIDSITAFIESVILFTIKDGLFYNALGKSCIWLGGINRLSDFNLLEKSEKSYRRVFRSLITKTLFKDIDFWRAIHKNKEIELDDILINLQNIRADSEDYSEFCSAVEAYFRAYYNDDKVKEAEYKLKLQSNFDCEYPYSSVLQAKKTKSKFYLGSETITYFSDNDISLPAEFIELLEDLDSSSVKPEINDLRSFYFTFSKYISDEPSLDKAWLKEITNSKATESNNLLEGLLSVLSKSIFLNDVGDDEIILSLAKDRTRKSLERKNWHALNFFNNEYRDLPEFWSQFGDNFTIDFGRVFDADFSSTVQDKNKKYGDAKSANELYFRIIRRSKNSEVPVDSWELKWVFNSSGFESSKCMDFSKVLERDGFFYKQLLALDPLFIKNSDSTPSIDNIHMFLAVSANMKKGAVVRKLDDEYLDFFNLLKSLKDHKYLTEEKYSEIDESYHSFYECWKRSLEILFNEPLCGEVGELEVKFDSLLKAIYSIDKPESNDLVYYLLAANTINIEENVNYCIYLPWSVYSLLMQSNRNKDIKKIVSKYENKSLSIANKSDGVLEKLFKDYLRNYGRTVFLKKIHEHKFIDLISTNSNSGYFEFGDLSASKNAINTSEIKSVLNATVSKFLETYPNERHHLQILCIGLFSYAHLLTVYDEVLKIANNNEEQLSVSLAFTCNDRNSLDSIYQTVCESFDPSKIDTNITLKIVNDINEVEDGEIDLVYNFDPLFSHNKVAVNPPKFISRTSNGINWEYCASRKVPADPIARKTQFSMNNHVQDSTGQLFHTGFMRSNSLDGESSFCREVNQSGLKDEINSILSKCNWLVIYDYLLSKEALSKFSDDLADGSNKRVLRYIQGEGSKRSLAIITDKETHYITKSLSQDLRMWKLVHPDDVSSLVERIFTLSNSFSSDTLLRSVGNGNFSHDLVGTSGAAALLEKLFEDKPKVSPIFWVHLDDYLIWFKSSVEDDAFKSIGRTVNYISDLLGVYISKSSAEEITINLIINESKLTNGSTDQGVKSCKQIKSTVDLVASMLNTSANVDFEYWLNKFFEFIIGNMIFSPNNFEFLDLIALDRQKIKINICGVSTVFHYDNDQVKTTSDFVYDTDYLCQLVVSYEDTRKIFNGMINPNAELDLFNGLLIPNLELNRSGTGTITNDVMGPASNQTEYSDTQSCLVESDTSSVEIFTGETTVTDEGVSKNGGINTAFKQDETSHNPLDSYDAGLIGVGTQSIHPSAASELVIECFEFLKKYNLAKEAEDIDISLIKSNIRSIFGHAKLPSSFADELVTPNSIVIKLHGNVNLEPEKIFKLKANFLSVVGLSLRLAYPAPGVMVLVFDRQKRDTVYYGDLLERTFASRRKTIDNGFNNRIMLGQDEYSDDAIFFKLDGASPHALIGGQTKSGKSILMNNMILDLMMTNTPDNLRLRLFDPKQVEFSAYSKAPHLAHSVVLEKEEAVLRLQELEDLMNERYKKLSTLGVKDFESHNRKFPEKRMSREVVFFDELADWILDSKFKAAAKDIIVRLSSKGRAAGVHLILATQRPSADVVFPQLRANLDTKIALKVDRDQNSEIILGESGAEYLLGYGHGIVKTEGDTHTIQVGFTDSEVFDDLVENVITYWKGKGY